MNLTVKICKIRLKHLVPIVILKLSILIFVKVYFENNVTNQLPLLVWWTPFMWESEKIITCQKSKCILTTNRNKLETTQPNAILFYGSDLQIDDLPLPRNNAIPWAIYHEESPKNLGFIHNLEGQKLFNITATFSRLSNLPLTLQYLDDIALLTGTKFFKQIKIKNALLDKLAPVLYIQKDCDTPIERDSYVRELMKYVKVDSYGDCLNNKKLDDNFVVKETYDLYNENFLHFVSQYKFVISIENAACYDYITEKLWRPLIVGSIPIYLGSPTIEDWLPNNKSAILIKDFKTPKDVAKMIHSLNSNDKLYNEYLDHKLKAKITNKRLINYYNNEYKGIIKYENSIQTFECFVCDNYNKESIVMTNIYNCLEIAPNNSWYYFWKMGKCQAKILNSLINDVKVKNISKETYNKLTAEYLKNSLCD